jgi:hypothetical protein
LPPRPYELTEPLFQHIFLPDKSAEVTGAASAAEYKATESTKATPSGERYFCIGAPNASMNFKPYKPDFATSRIGLRRFHSFLGCVP